MTQARLVTLVYWEAPFSSPSLPFSLCSLVSSLLALQLPHQGSQNTRTRAHGGAGHPTLRGGRAATGPQVQRLFLRLCCAAGVSPGSDAA